MTFLGLDSAPARTGFAVVSRIDRKETVMRSGWLPKLSGPGMLEFLHIHGAVDRVIIEAPYLGANPKTHEQLARYVGRWECACEILGLKYKLMLAERWQMGVLRGLITPQSPRAARKLAAQKWVELTFGICAGEDESDAIAMTTFALREASVRQRALPLTKAG